MKFIALCLTFFIFNINSALAHTLIIDAQVRAFIPGTSSSVAYFTLENDTKDMRTLVGAEIKGVGRVEIHQHEFIDGMMKMSQLTMLDIAPFSQIKFRPGGLHLMLFEPTKLIKAGETTILKLHFFKGESISIQANIVKLGQE
ncbi:copper chaperone PCu(A)C [Pseudoalteromonas denitrificans]|uniref:Copper(I)-binding protein n=1 Tax=Pseudoalteromonas denitrificans DSM 6059 TaxID=1123010 RepID=A0A1I1PNY2_9GAMM|nr:copper chaperone PCu(A)C [Pseudoalteromonas denitrificans]SFD07690.1 hypothetical protein SAMN02745724_03396 [Pseudoalteromonas denitrificans DSM 6059]